MQPGQVRAGKTLIEQFRATLPHPLDDFQLEAIQALAAGHSVLVAAPTGTGKTVIADFGAFQARTAGLRAFYTTPIKALSNQKYRDYRALYGDEVGLRTIQRAHRSAALHVALVSSTGASAASASAP